MSLTIEDRYRMDGKFVLDTESRRYPFLKAYPPAHGDNSFYAYLGYDAQDDLRALGKAILNAVEPEALVENQKATEPEPYKPQVGDAVRVTAFADDDPWHNHVGIITDAAKYASCLEVKSADDSIEYTALVGYNEVTPASAPTPEPEHDVAALVAAVDSLKERVAYLEAAAKDDEIKVGDLVRYTSEGGLPGLVRKVANIHGTGAGTRYRLVHTTGDAAGSQAHPGVRRNQIEKVN